MLCKNTFISHVMLLPLLPLLAGRHFCCCLEGIPGLLFLMVADDRFPYNTFLNPVLCVCIWGVSRSGGVTVDEENPASHGPEDEEEEVKRMS